MTIDSDFQEKATEYKQKLVISGELVKVSKTLYMSFQALSKIEKSKIDQLEHIKTFTTKFYNKDCIYRDYADQIKKVIEIEIIESSKLVG